MYGADRSASSMMLQHRYGANPAAYPIAEEISPQPSMKLMALRLVEWIRANDPWATARLGVVKDGGFNHAEVSIDLPYVPEIGYGSMSDEQPSEDARDRVRRILGEAVLIASRSRWSPVAAVSARRHPRGIVVEFSI